MDEEGDLGLPGPHRGEGIPEQVLILLALLALQAPSPPCTGVRRCSPPAGLLGGSVPGPSEAG